MSTPPSAQTPPARVLPRATRLAYGVGQVAEGIKSFSFSLFVLFYYNSVLGLSGSLTGAAVGIALIVDAITDPLAGSISDNWRSRWGRRHPFIVGSALPLALAFGGLFSPPAGLGELGLFVWLTVFAVATRTAMTAYHVPHMSLGAELTSDFTERTRLVATRQIAGYLGAFVMAGIGFGWFFADERGGRTQVEAYAPFGWTMAAIMLVTILWSAWGTRREIPHLPQPAPESSGGRADAVRVLPRLFEESRGAFQNRSFRRLFAGTLLIYVMVGTESALALYMYEFFWQLGAREILALSLLYPVGLVIGAGFTRRLHEAWDKSPTLVFGVVGWSFCQLAPVIGRLVGVMPENGTTALIGTLLAFRLVQGALVQQALVSFSSMMADIADEHELVSGRRQEGIFFGVVSFSGKAASGAGSFIAGITLDVIDWPAGLGNGEAVAVPAETVRALGIAYGPLVAIFAVAALAAYRGYDLDRRRHREILRALAARHQEGPDPGGAPP